MISRDKSSRKTRTGRNVRKKPARTKASAKAHAVPVQGSSRPPAQGATRVSALDPRAKVEITVTLRGPKLPPAARLIGNSLSLGEFRARYGASQRDIDKVSQVLRTYGLKIESISRETRSIRVSGTVAQMEDAFQP